MVRPRGMNGRRVKKEHDAAIENFDIMQHRSITGGKSGGPEGGIKQEIDLGKYFGVNRIVPKHINLFHRDEALELWNEARPYEALQDSVRLLENPPKSTYRYIAELKRHVSRLSQILLFDERLINQYQSIVDRLEDGAGERSGKRWTEEEDEMLIDRAVQDNANTIDLATEFGRTPGAIVSRISYLVGKKRISTKVAGNFVGLFNGEEVTGNIDGTVINS